MKRVLSQCVMLIIAVFAIFAVAERVNAVEPANTRKASTVQIYQTAENTGQKLTRLNDKAFEKFGQPLETQACIFIDPSKTFQTVIGIGGSLTDASAEVFASLDASKQEAFLTSYYDVEQGIGYSIARTNIQSCDFSSGSYSYVENNDKDLKTFSIDHDLRYRIPLIKKAFAAADQLSLYASPWSPPAWMKSNNDVLHGGSLKPEYYQAWAQFFVKFIKSYEQEGIPVWGITVQNEPMATQIWESCIYTAEQERDFVKNNLGPALHRSGLSDKKLIIWDHNRDLIYQRASTVLNDPEAAKYVWGVGFHWYVHDVFDNIKRVQEAFPETNLIFTEGCAERFDKDRIGDWNWGEKYGISMVHDLNNGAVGWTDWNMLLDERGGPNHVGNFCYAPVHKTSEGGLFYMNSFYYIGHFSKFIRPGAKRIISSSNRDNMLSTAFLNPDGTVAVVVLNTSDETIPYKLWLNGDAAPVESLPHSIVTMIIE